MACSKQLTPPPIISQSLFGCFKRTHISCVIEKIVKKNIRPLIPRKDKDLAGRNGSLVTSPSPNVGSRAVKGSSSLEQKRQVIATTLGSRTLGAWVLL